eukprot:s8419_g2.t1
MADVEAVFGFGSNSVRQLRGRLEDPEITGFPARVRNYALAFCTATLIQKDGQVALGTVVYLSDKHMDVLDGYEGTAEPARTVMCVSRVVQELTRCLLWGLT